jgi:hypothetical protein
MLRPASFFNLYVCSDTIEDGSNGDTATDHYHRYMVLCFFSQNANAFSSQNANSFQGTSTEDYCSNADSFHGVLFRRIFQLL